MMISPPSAPVTVTIPALIPGAQLRWLKNLARLIRGSLAAVAGLDRGARLLALDAARANGEKVKAIKARMSRAQMERALEVAQIYSADPDMALVAHNLGLTLRFWKE